MEELAASLCETEDAEALLDNMMTLYGTDILRLSYTYVKNKAIAEDLTQDIFIKCYKSLHTYNGDAKLRTWLWRIAINHCKDYLKSWHHRNIVLKETEEPATYGSPVENKLIGKEENEWLSEAVMSLPVKYREVIYLFYFEERAIKEMAQVLNANENTIKTRLRKAKKLLRERVEGYEWKSI